MPDLDLAKLREQIAREICPEEIDAWNALYASAIADGVYHETAILCADTWHRRGKRSAEKAADRILSLLRPALQAAWKEGAEAERDRLQPMADELMKLADDVGEADDPFAAWEAVQAIIAERDRLAGLVREAGEALKPFAEIVEKADERALKSGFAPSFDEYEVEWSFTFGSLRRARALASRLKAEGGAGYAR